MTRENLPEADRLAAFLGGDVLALRTARALVRDPYSYIRTPDDLRKAYHDLGEVRMIGPASMARIKEKLGLPCPVCWTSHGCDLPRGHTYPDHLCLGIAEALPDQDSMDPIVFYDVCSRSPVGAPANFMADWTDKATLFGPEVIV